MSLPSWLVTAAIAAVIILLWWLLRKLSHCKACGNDFVKADRCPKCGARVE